MEFIYGLLIGLACGGVGGYLLATHIHSIANAAAQKAVSAIDSAVGAPKPTTTT